MDLLTTLVLGAYIYTTMYTTAVFLWFQKKYEAIRTNHLKHVEDALNETRKQIGLPPVKLTDYE